MWKDTSLYKAWHQCKVIGGRVDQKWLLVGLLEATAWLKRCPSLTADIFCKMNDTFLIVSAFFSGCTLIFTSTNFTATWFLRYRNIICTTAGVNDIFRRAFCKRVPPAMMVSIIHEDPNNASLFATHSLKVTCVFTLSLPQQKHTHTSRQWCPLILIGLIFIANPCHLNACLAGHRNDC